MSWSQKWEDAKAFEPVVDAKKKKFFLTFPYPYVNGYAHLGHSYTIMRVDAFARYKRLKGFNVLFPQGWHATGSPIVLAAKRVAQKEPKQIAILNEMGFTDVKPFENPVHWVKVFAPAMKEDFQKLGLSIDWSREFVTTSLNPYYDKFIEWQFRKLKEKGYVIKGKFPVVWDPKNNLAIGDHDRAEGEGETPQEFTLIKYKLGAQFVVVATLRPETMYGQTNLWVNPDITYVTCTVDSEEWIVSRECAAKLATQGFAVNVVGDVPGKTLIGKTVRAPFVERDIPILPSFFPRSDKGTGLVTSVPSDAPDDYIGLRDLWNDPALCLKLGVDHSLVSSIKVIPIITTDIGDSAAVSIVEEMKIKNQHERVKLEEAKKIVYKKGFYEGVMNARCGQYSGMPVQKAKELIKRELLSLGAAHLFYELTGRVVSRGLVECVVKIVDDQWFIDYANPVWKEQTKRALEQCTLYPSNSRAQFEFTIDWLREWACTREEGLGTALPWDKKWLIESLSDSTLYMAYYTFVPHLMKVPLEKVSDAWFDFVLLGRGVAPDAHARAAREEFLYWYPCDFRNSGKDLIQNHLTFHLFTHVAIFDAPHWPAGIGVNGHITVNGAKMSKSAGNFITLRDGINRWGADALRAGVLNGGEGLDDANFEFAFAQSFGKKLNGFIALSKTQYGVGRSARVDIDNWFESKMNTLLLEITPLMEETLFRTALQKIAFEYSNLISKYLAKGEPQKDLISIAIENLAIMLSVYCPFTAEEMWSSMGKKGFVSLATWPTADESKIDKRAEAVQEFIESTLALVENAKQRTGKEVKKVTLGIALPWKYVFASHMIAQLKKTYNVKEILEYFKTVPSLDKYISEVTTLVPAIIKRPARLPSYFLEREDELRALERVSIALEEKYDCEVEIVEDGEVADKAFPGGVGVRI